MNLIVKEFYDSNTFTLTYVVYDPKTKDGIVIDPVLDYDPLSSRVSTKSADIVLQYLTENNINIHYILETHAHADHLSSAQYLKSKLKNSRVAIGAHIIEVQKVFKKIFNLPESFKTDGSQFDLLLKEEVDIKAGSINITTLHTPGHTPACSSYLIENLLFTGDSLFMPDFGTGRCDFPAGSAEDLFVSISNKIYRLPNEIKVFVGHDYQPNGRPLAFTTTVGEEKKSNIHINSQTKLESFTQFRRERDKKLEAPKLLFESVQVNINGGHLPEPESNGGRFFKIPIL